MDRKEIQQLDALLEKGHPLDIARIIEDADSDQQFEMLEKLSVDRLNDVIIELSDELAHAYIGSLPLSKKKKLVNALEMDEIRKLLEEVDKVEIQEILHLLNDEKRQKMINLLAYSEDVAASLMNTDFIVIQNNSSIADATKLLIRDVKNSDFIDEIFVIDQNQNYVGSIELKNLLSAHKTDQLDSIVEQNQTVIYEHDSVRTAIQKLRNYDVTVMPVLRQRQLIGIITADDILDIMIEEYEEDVERLVAVGDYEEDSSALTRTKQRLPWLLASIILNLVIAAFLSFFQTTVEQISALILFQPMILGMAGNIGTQAIAVTILGLHHDKLNDSKSFRTHILKEVMIGVVNSLMIAFLGFVIAFGFLSVVSMGEQSPLLMSGVVGTSLFGGMLVSSICGVFIPIVLDKFKVDPAVASGPIISTINDLFALLIYFGIATLMFL